ncbi:hypothetical protein GGI25_002573 [Coemansia spiralis]|uniref:Sfi1 spindle body domain-containing protein n=2 Tax=Coemansia TaxID=4863 RepID=A0A9W8GAD9_9FUNG|nr:hypothetical protein EDC05_002424 [Coemansia umbellata]KAJ2622862.1 hypothetical protein GGI26_002828 [Coemansia sp. RSA 1358]KAJ2678222.1 hypothetical protein GGI25_002573 [Coemansia spiralis]
MEEIPTAQRTTRRILNGGGNASTKKPKSGRLLEDQQPIGRYANTRRILDSHSDIDIDLLNASEDDSDRDDSYVPKLTQPSSIYTIGQHRPRRQRKQHDAHNMEPANAIVLREFIGSKFQGTKDVFLALMLRRWHGIAKAAALRRQELLILWYEALDINTKSLKRRAFAKLREEKDKILSSPKGQYERTQRRLADEHYRKTQLRNVFDHLVRTRELQQRFETWQSIERQRLLKKCLITWHSKYFEKKEDAIRRVEIQVCANSRKHVLKDVFSCWRRCVIVDGVGHEVQWRTERRLVQRCFLEWRDQLLAIQDSEDEQSLVPEIISPARQHCADVHRRRTLTYAPDGDMDMEQEALDFYKQNPSHSAPDDHLSAFERKRISKEKADRFYRFCLMTRAIETWRQQYRAHREEQVQSRAIRDWTRKHEQKRRRVLLLAWHNFATKQGKASQAIAHASEPKPVKPLEYANAQTMTSMIGESIAHERSVSRHSEGVQTSDKGDDTADKREIMRRMNEAMLEADRYKTLLADRDNDLNEMIAFKEELGRRYDIWMERDRARRVLSVLRHMRIQLRKATHVREQQELADIQQQLEREQAFERKQQELAERQRWLEREQVFEREQEGLAERQRQLERERAVEREQARLAKEANDAHDRMLRKMLLSWRNVADDYSQQTALADDWCYSRKRLANRTICRNALTKWRKPIKERMNLCRLFEMTYKNTMESKFINQLRACYNERRAMEADADTLAFKYLMSRVWSHLCYLGDKRKAERKQLAVESRLLSDQDALQMIANENDFEQPASFGQLAGTAAGAKDSWPLWDENNEEELRLYFTSWHELVEDVRQLQGAVIESLPPILQHKALARVNETDDFEWGVFHQKYLLTGVLRKWHAHMLNAGTPATKRQKQSYSSAEAQAIHSITTNRLNSFIDASAFSQPGIGKAAIANSTREDDGPRAAELRGLERQFSIQQTKRAKRTYLHRWIAVTRGSLFEERQLSNTMKRFLAVVAERAKDVAAAREMERLVVIRSAVRKWRQRLYIYRVNEENASVQASGTLLHTCILHWYSQIREHRDHSNAHELLMRAMAFRWEKQARMALRRWTHASSDTRVQVRLAERDGRRGEERLMGIAMELSSAKIARNAFERLRTAARRRRLHQEIKARFAVAWRNTNLKRDIMAAWRNQISPSDSMFFSVVGTPD